MITRLGLVVSLLILLGLFMVLKENLFGESIQLLLFSVAFLLAGTLTLFKTDKVISPIFASWRFELALMKLLGLVFLLWGLAGLAELVVGM